MSLDNLKWSQEDWDKIRLDKSLKNRSWFQRFEGLLVRIGEKIF